MAAFYSMGAFANESIAAITDSKGKYPSHITGISDTVRVSRKASANRTRCEDWVDIKRPLGSFADATSLAAAPRYGRHIGSMNQKQSHDHWHALCQVRSVTNIESTAEVVSQFGSDYAGRSNEQVSGRSKWTISTPAWRKESQAVQSWSSWSRVS